MYEGTTQRELLFHTSRQLSGTPVFKRFNLRINIFHDPVILLYGRFKNSGEEVNILLNGEILVQRKSSGHISYSFPDSFIILNRIEPIYQSFSAILYQQCGKNPEEACFTSAI